MRCLLDLFYLPQVANRKNKFNHCKTNTLIFKKELDKYIIYPAVDFRGDYICTPSEKKKLLFYFVKYFH